MPEKQNRADFRPERLWGVIAPHLFLELGVAALAAALPVGMSRQKDAVAAPGTDRFLGFDGIPGQLIISGDTLGPFSLLSTLLSCHLARLRSGLFGLGKCISLDDMGPLYLLGPLFRLIDLGVSNCLTLSELGLQAIHKDQADLGILGRSQPLHNALSSGCCLIMNDLERNLPSFKDGIVLLTKYLYIQTSFLHNHALH